MSIYCKQLKLLRAAFWGLFLTIFSVYSNASESKLDIDAPQAKNSSVTITVNELAEIKATLSKQERTIKLLIEKQQRNEEKNQPKESTRLDHRLKSIESSLNTMSDKDNYFTYADWAAIAITCVAVILTIIGLGIAALAFWGYGEIKELTKNSAAKEAKTVATQTMEEMINGVAKSELEKLINDGKLQETLQAAVDIIMRNDPDNIEKKRSEELFHELDIVELEFDGDQSDENLNDGKI